MFRDSARRQKRPFLASHCEHLSDAENFRNQIIREISEGVRKIQNAGLGEHAIRDLNDVINKLLREKYHWNRRIKELGGRDYNVEERKAMVLAEREGSGGRDGDGDGVGRDPESLAAMGLGLKGSGGYRYFGAARDLPGVKELFARHATKTTKRKRGDIYKYITPDYYGLRDEEDGVLLELEEEMATEKRKVLKLCREKYRGMKQCLKNDKVAENDNGGRDDDDKGGSEESSDEDTFFDEMVNGIVPQAAMPSWEVVSQVLLQKKKDALLNRFS